MAPMPTDTVRQERHRDWIKADEVAEMLGVSVYTVRSWRYRRQGPPAYRMSTAIRYDRAEVEEWHRRHRLIGDGTVEATR